MAIVQTGSNPVSVTVTGANTTTSPSNALQDINDSIAAQIESGATVDGFGLAFNSTSTVVGATIAIINDGTLSTDQNSNFALLVNAGAAGGPSNFGTFTYSGSGSLTDTGSGGDALSFTNPTSNVDITVSGTSTISGSTTGHGIEASSGNATATVGVTVLKGGMVEGETAVSFGGGVSTLNNSGTLQGVGSLSGGVSGQVATVINSGTISGTTEGVGVDNVTLTNNSGAMIETTGTTSAEAALAAIAAVEALTAADITNKSGATIQATGPLGQVGILVGQAGATGNATVNNAGTISGNGNAINTNTSGLTTITNTGTISNTTGGGATPGDIRVNVASITNMGTGNIDGADFGIVFRNSQTTGSTIFNAGTISGTTAAIQFSSASSDNTLTLGPGFTITGNVTQGANNILQLGGSSGAGTFNVSNIGASAQYRNFTTFNKIDTSTWTLTGTGTQAWTVEQGTLQVDGTIGDTTVQSGAMLDGTGTTGALTVDSGGTLAPGDDPGTINTGNLNLQAGSNLSIEIEGTSPGVGGFSDVVVTGSVTLAGTLSTTLLNGFTPQAGQSFEIINNDGADAVSGTFAGLAEGASFTQGGTTYSISYAGGTGNDVVLTVLTVGSDIPPVTDLNGPGAGSDNTASFINAPVLIAPVATVTDADNADLTSLTATLTARPDGDAAESLSLNATAAAVASADNLTVTYTAATGVLSVTGLAGTADYQSILQGVVYDDTNATRNTTDRNVNVVVNDGTDSSINHSVTISVQANAVTGQTVLNSATEGTAIASGTPVATFSDANLGDTAGDFSATINWGDGSTPDTGAAVTITGSSGSFTVKGGHTYADEGSEPLSVTLTHTSDNTSATASGSVTVADADGLVVTADNFGGNPGVAVNNVQVATFTDTFAGQVANDLDAMINWGDGSSSAGTVSETGGTFTVTGSHTYTTAGNFTFNVSVDDAGGVSATATGSAAINFAGQVVLPGATEGTALPNGTPVATFTDGNTSDAVGDFSATINWGDGSMPDTGAAVTIVGGSGSFTVEGSHTYVDEGSEPLSVTLTRTADNASATASGSVTVTDADGFVVTADPFSSNPGVATNNVQVATFTDAFTGQVPADLDATINWGDGSSSAGTVSETGGTFTVTGSHTYTTGGNHTFNVSVDDAGGASATATGTATTNFAGQMVLTSAPEGTALPNNTQVATFSDSDSGDAASSFTALIEWGDGASSAGTVTGVSATPGGSTRFTVSGGHTYADEGSDTATVILTHTADHSTATVSGSVAVTEADSLTPHGTSFTANAHQIFTGTVATFSDGDIANVAGDFIASIDWGDGQTTSGTVGGGNGSFTVSGSHVYAAAGQDTVTVKLADDAPGTASATATTSATVNQGAAFPFDVNGDAISDVVFQNNGEPGIWLWNGTAPTAEVGLTNPGASWHIITSRDVNGDGKADLIWQNIDGTPGIWLMNGTTPIAEAGLTNPGASWHVVASGDTNSDGNADLIWQNTDGTLGVWEMNGTTPTAEVGLNNPGSNWKVVGAADFNGDNNDDILLQDKNTGNLMIDLMNGTTISSTITITVGDLSWHAVSTGTFNGQAEIAWQNNNGAAGIWLMNGTTPAAEAGLQNPGAGWQLLSVDHFTPDGRADLLFQNSGSNALQLWEMNGTSVAAMVNLPNPGAGWQSVNGHPFATG
jgi:VCBS repeat protein